MTFTWRSSAARLRNVAKFDVAQVHSVEHELLAHYTPDAYSLALQQLIAKLQPAMVLFPHTYQVRDFAPKLSTAMRRVYSSAMSSLCAPKGTLAHAGPAALPRERSTPIFASPANHLVSPLYKRVRGEPIKPEPAAAPIEVFTPQLEAAQIRTKPGERFREAARAVDLSAAQIIVSVGRGIKDAENLPMIEKLAEALGAELAASRPICDNGWLPMERQVGSSGQTVAPKAYFAIGISGAIQHLVGMKGSKLVIAINRDPEAPIFEIADYGIVGDLFEVVPALTEEIRKQSPR